MSDELKQAVLRYTASSKQADITAVTPVSGLFLIQRTTPSELEHSVIKPLVCLVLQGRKRVAIANDVFSYGTGDTMIVTGNVPTASRINEASAANPYLSLALDLDPAVITDLVMGTPGQSSQQTWKDTDKDLRDALRRLVLLLERPDSLRVLKDALIREIHHWLLLGPHGQAVRNLGLPDSHSHRIARAVSILRAEFAQHLPIERLAAAAGMSRSTFHQHFRSITSLSPLQFQKHLRLIEARRLVLSQGKAFSQVAFEVGYESASQFSREYARMYGRSPAKDKQTMGARLGEAAGTRVFPQLSCQTPSLCSSTVGSDS
jgi:AraC-like DNA-binding protein